MTVLRTLRTITVALTLVVTACASRPPAETADETADEAADTSGKTVRTLLAIGAAVAVGAILVNQAESNVEDAVNDATRQ